jgi:hypothetical protein
MTSQKYFGVDEAFWQKLTKAAEGTDSLDATDAKRIVHLLKADGENGTESKIVSLIVNRLKGSEDILEQGFLRYLSENFNKLVVGEGQEPPDSPLFPHEENYTFPSSPQVWLYFFCIVSSLYSSRGCRARSFRSSSRPAIGISISLPSRKSLPVRLRPSASTLSRSTLSLMRFN